MKKIILFFSILYSVSAFAQNNIHLNIIHKMNGADFAIKDPFQNNIGHDFEFTRMQYYISGISIIHDGGIETPIENRWILTDAKELTAVDLGDFDITTVEQLRFHIGVDEAHNHLDPASYPPTHPLAPVFPSMHWGWAAGYRFVALEGNGGPNHNQLVQLHGLDDQHYFQTSVDFNISAEMNQITIDLYADYAKALKDINVNSGAIVHGGFGAAVDCLENFRDYVFSATATPTTSTINTHAINDFSVYPNPSFDGQSTIRLASSQNAVYQLEVVDALGRIVQRYDTLQGNSTMDIQLPQAGFYLVYLMQEGQTILSRKLIKL